MKIKEKAQSIKAISVEIKDSFSLRQFTMIIVVLFGAAANILSDYLTPGFDPSIFYSPAYWINLCISQAAVIVIMFCVYGFTAEREESANTEVKKLRATIYKAHCDLSELGLSDGFDKYVAEQNLERKKRAYKKKMERKIFRARTDKRRNRLKDKMSRGLEMIESIRVRYNRIRIATIFSRASLPLTEDGDIEDGRIKTTRRMLINKVTSIIAFGVLLSMITLDPKTFAWGLIIKTFIKVFQAAYAMYVGGSEGVNYVRGPLLTALDNRTQFVQKFIDSNKQTEEEPAEKQLKSDVISINEVTAESSQGAITEPTVLSKSLIDK